MNDKLKVLEFPAVEKDPSDQERIVSMLTDLLERAKQGEFETAMFMAMDGEGDMVIATTADCSITALGMLTLAQRAL
jgi:hypothetical protein